jgi:6-pyruvoyltetrahydropterin/6-carboxytetrahydropterin synthase
MVMDFSEAKSIAQANLVDAWDHAFLAWRDDLPVIEFLATLPGHKTVLFDAPPTAENLAIAAFRLLDRAYQNNYGNNLRLECVRIYETPNCWADATREEVRT